MKTLLIVLAIVALLGMVVFILVREHKNVDEQVSQPDSDAPEVSEEDEAEVEVAIPKDDDKPEIEPEVEPEQEPEANIPEHCKPQDDPVDTLPNKYFFNIHKYITARHRSMFCVVCNAVIDGNNYKVIVANSFYPYIGSYTKSLCTYIASKYLPNMTVEEFLKTGSTNFDRVGEIVDSLPFVY